VQLHYRSCYEVRVTTRSQVLPWKDTREILNTMRRTSMHRRSSAEVSRTKSASRSRRVSAPLFSKRAASARFERESACRTTFALANGARGGTFSMRREGGDGRNKAPHGDDLAHDLASARAASSLRLEKQVRLARSLPRAPSRPPPVPLAQRSDHDTRLTAHLVPFSFTATGGGVRSAALRVATCSRGGRRRQRRRATSHFVLRRRHRRAADAFR